MALEQYQSLVFPDKGLREYSSRASKVLLVRWKHQNDGILVDDLRQLRPN